MTTESDAIIRDYAAGRISWQVLQQRGVDYLAMLSQLARLGLRPPIAPAEDQGKARDIIKKALLARTG